jgi:antitoxin component YwqK of YwqJK toxin-antitoxin module
MDGKGRQRFPCPQHERVTVMNKLLCLLLIATLSVLGCSQANQEVDQQPTASSEKDGVADPKKLNEPGDKPEPAKEGPGSQPTETPKGNPKDAPQQEQNVNHEMPEHFEGEKLHVIKKSRTFTVHPQDMRPFKDAKWSNDAHLVAAPKNVGDWVELALPIRASGKYRVTVVLTKAADYGIVQVHLNGMKLGDPIDCFIANKVVTTEPLVLGSTVLTKGTATLKMALVGTNPKSIGVRNLFALDYIELTLLKTREVQVAEKPKEEPAKGDPPQKPAKLQSKILQEKTWTWNQSTFNYAKQSDLVFEVGMGNHPKGLGAADAGIEIENIRNINLSVEASQVLLKLGLSYFAGFYVDYHTANGYAKRVALSIGVSSEKRLSNTPIWGKFSRPDQYVDLGRKKEYDLDLKQWAPDGWDGKVWFVVSLQNTGKNTTLKVKAELFGEENKLEVVQKPKEEPGKKDERPTVQQKTEVAQKPKEEPAKKEKAKGDTKTTVVQRPKVTPADDSQKTGDFSKLDYSKGPNGEKIIERQGFDKKENKVFTEQGFKRSDGQFVAHGKSTSWYEKPTSGTEGKKYACTYCFNGQLHGKFIQWYESGQTWKEGAIVDGKLSGVGVSWHKNGQKLAEGSFLSGSREGKWTWWHDNGQKMCELWFKNGDRDGKFIEWDSKGVKTVEMAYSSDRIVLHDPLSTDDIAMLIQTVTKSEQPYFKVDAADALINSGFEEKVPRTVLEKLASENNDAKQALKVIDDTAMIKKLIADKNARSLVFRADTATKKKQKLFDFMIDGMNSCIESGCAYATNSDVIIRFSTESKWWPRIADSPIEGTLCHPLLISIYDKDGERLSRFTTKEGFTLYNDTFNNWRGATKWEAKLLSRRKNTLVYRVNARILRDAAIIEVGFCDAKE